MYGYFSESLIYLYRQYYLCRDSTSKIVKAAKITDIIYLGEVEKIETVKLTRRVFNINKCEIYIKYIKLLSILLEQIKDNIWNVN
jgi:hypothetical protein